jgi:hypothetical protein
MIKKPSMASQHKIVVAKSQSQMMMFQRFVDDIIGKQLAPIDEPRTQARIKTEASPLRSGMTVSFADSLPYRKTRILAGYKSQCSLLPPSTNERLMRVYTSRNKRF